jgi:hypothetical protein
LPPFALIRPLVSGRLRLSMKAFGVNRSLRERKKRSRSIQEGFKTAISMDATTTTPPRQRPVHWLNVLTVVSAAILIGAEVFGAAFASSWAIASLFELGGTVARILDVVLMLLGAFIMVQFIRNARRIEPFTG